MEKQYFRLRFKPAGYKRPKTVLVRLVSEDAGRDRSTYVEVDRDGTDRETGTWTAVKGYVVMTTFREGTRTPLRMNLHYGELEDAT